MDIITGRTSEPHVYAEDDGLLNWLANGDQKYVVYTGSQFSYQLLDATTIRINDGVVLMNGRLGRIRPGNYEDISLPTGTAGYYRKDRIVIRYENTNGIESMRLVLITGTPATTSAGAAYPNYNTGSPAAGDSPVDFPIYNLLTNGINPPTVYSQLEEQIIRGNGIQKVVQDKFDAVIG